MKKILFILLVMMSSCSGPVVFATVTPATNISVITSSFSHCLGITDTNVQTSLNDIDTCIGGLPSTYVTSFNTRTGAVVLLSSDVTGALGYTPLSNITGLITPGTNVTITGSGTSGSPYQISSSGEVVTPGGSNTSVQFNNLGSFGGDSNFTYVTSPSVELTLNGTFIPNSITLGSSTDALAVSSGNVQPVGSPSKNYALLYNGTKPVWAPQGTSFNFSIASYAIKVGGVTKPSGTIFEIGSGSWEAAGQLSFTAAYNNGPATGGYISHSGWTNLTLTNTFQGPTVSISGDNYPSVGTSLSYTLNATDGSLTPTSLISYFFDNDNYYGVSTTNSGFTAGDVTGLASSYLTNSRATTFSVTAGSGYYIIWASPVRLGAVTFTVGGFAGGFNAPETVSVTNGSGYTENYYVYSSVQPNLGLTTVVTS